jgi:cleavage and polyadenylation specificity factor subunit 5
MDTKKTELVVYPISNYSFGSKAPKQEKDNSVPARLERLRQKYSTEGVRHSVDALPIVYEHGHPHVLLFQVGMSYFKLPGGRLRPGESDKEGLLRKLDTNLAPEDAKLKPDWKIGECVGTYYRPNFDNVMYPYIPPHIERPKEVRNLYVIQLPERCYLSVPSNYKLIAVPLFELYDHIQRYGPIIAAVPGLLSRLNFVLAEGYVKDEDGKEGDDIKVEDKEMVEA